MTRLWRHKLDMKDGQNEIEQPLHFDSESATMGYTKTDEEGGAEHE